VDTTQSERFLKNVARIHGDVVRDECQRLLNDQPDGSSLSTLSVLCKAQQNLFKDQIEAAAAASLRCFDSDGDL
jgi:hypothetical protein